jgi:hypothetical protein
LALEDHERLVFQTLVSSMVDALSQRGRGATLGLMLLLLRRFEEIQQRPGDNLFDKLLDLDEEDMTLGGVRWWKAGQLRNLLLQLMLGADEGSSRGLRIVQDLHAEVRFTGILPSQQQMQQRARFAS